ncbi:hypothetical protein COCNU_scaffold035077G000010 [Cocos nucifera]|nr:hypothetical protein [Cocos nucifera]
MDEGDGRLRSMVVISDGMDEGDGRLRSMVVIGDEMDEGDGRLRSMLVIAMGSVAVGIEVVLTSLEVEARDGDNGGRFLAGGEGTMERAGL